MEVFKNMIILEIQHTNNGATSPIVTVKEDRSAAEQLYHNTLAYAAVSNVDVHSVVMLTDDGVVHKKETYYHNGGGGE